MATTYREAMACLSVSAHGLTAISPSLRGTSAATATATARPPTEPASSDPRRPRNGVLFVELKNAGGLLTADQMAWRDRLLLAGQDWRCWRPKHLPEVQATLAPAPWSNLRLTEDHYWRSDGRR